MRVAISTTRPFHSALLANALTRRAGAVRIYSPAPRRFFRRLDDAVQLTVVPSVVQAAMHLLPLELPDAALHADSWLYDRSVAAVLRSCDVFVGWATASLASGRAVRRRGARFVLDRACPHVDFQQAILREEAAKTGFRFHPEPAWFRDRQLAEYEEAERILVPSDYTQHSFPAALQAKTIKAPLFGRCGFPADVQVERNPVFTVGVVGGDPLRKGYLYLLEAWKRLALPNARLLIRSGADFRRFPRLQSLLGGLDNIELVPYLPDINDFYRRCDAFVLPSVDDGFGMALFEAMANGVPCIATTHCGSSELLTSGRDGIVVPPFESGQIADALLSLFESEDFRRSVGAAGRATVASLMRENSSGGSSPLYDCAIEELLRSLEHQPSLAAAAG
ncbi:MAG: glycosyltransferase family 4 protein [Acidobacteriaceae bacterium]